jgi:hypothetical protein
MKAVTRSEIAHLAYEARRAYALALGEEAPPRWEQATLPERSEAIAGVDAVLSGEARSGAHLHDTWARRAADEPTLELAVPRYSELELEQRRKILLFRAVVLALIDGPCNGFCHDEKCGNLDDHDCHLDTCMSRFGVPPGLLDAEAPRSGGGQAAAKLYC